MDKIAIHVPHQLLSEAVQKMLFKMGYGWLNGHSVKGFDSVTFAAGLCICFASGETLSYDFKSYFESLPDDYTILSVDEFFAMEEEKKKEWPKSLTLDDVEVMATRRHAVLADKEGEESIVVTWPELDKILALKPETTP